jgi:Kef-type K+ transport system membrane component KefB
MFIFLLFVGIGRFAEAAPLAALLAGLSVRHFVPKERLSFIDSEIKAMAYGFFVPIFFLWVGAGMDMSYVLAAPWLILSIVFIAKGVKILGSYIVGRRELGTKQSILLGIGLSVRFSTSIVIIKVLFDNNLINADLYSLLIASSIVFKFIVPVLFASLLVRWGVVRTGWRRWVPVTN